MFIDSGKVTSRWSKEPPFMTTREELKKDTARKNGKINCSGLEKNLGRLDKKRELVLLILNRGSNNTQLLTNGRAGNKHLILFKLFLPKSKSINLAFLLTNLLL